MSEYKTLNEFFPDGKGDGRKFVAEKNEVLCFTPHFKTIYGTWHGLDFEGIHQAYDGKSLFKEYTEPKKTKKVTMYSRVFSGGEYSKHPYVGGDMMKVKGDWKEQQIGWIEHIVEIEEEDNHD